MSASIVADTAQCFSTHQFACLIGYGARLFLGLFNPPYMVFLVYCCRFILRLQWELRSIVIVIYLYFKINQIEFIC